MASATQAAKFSHYMSANCLVPTSTSSGDPLRCAGALIETPNVTTFLATGPIAASALPNGFFLLNPGAASVLTLPTAAQIVAAFTAAGNPLSVGSSFVVRVQNVSTAFAVKFAPTTATNGVIPMRADLGTITTAAYCGGLLYFIATNVTSGAEAISYSFLKSSL